VKSKKQGIRMPMPSNANKRIRSASMPMAAVGPDKTSARQKNLGTNSQLRPDNIWSANAGASKENRLSRSSQKATTVGFDGATTNSASAGR
jgi:hypothetical protein